jgi:Na+-translocating ferredoxin:NAD+ oxidoreductase RnfA subunit
MASLSMSYSASATASAPAVNHTPAQGALDSAGAGITGGMLIRTSTCKHPVNSSNIGYTGDSLSLKIMIAFLLGLSLYNAIELIVLVFVTFKQFRGVYFWSMLIAAGGIIPYSLGFIIKFFQLLDPSRDEGYVAVVFLTIGWYLMVTGQSVVLWSRLHLLSNSRRVLRWTLWMIIVNGTLLHSITTVLTFGSNSNSLTPKTLQRFVNGYSIMEKIQMVGFFLQELILSAIYIREAIRLLKMSEVAHDDVQSFDNGTTHGHLRNSSVRKTMYQLLAVNVIIIAMDLALLGVEFVNLYLIETTLKGVVYSIKLKLEFAVLGKLVQFVRDRASSSNTSDPRRPVNVLEHGATSSGATIEKTETNRTNNSVKRSNASPLSNGVHRGPTAHHFPDFVDPNRVSTDVTHAQPSEIREEAEPSWETRAQEEGEAWRRRSKAKANRGSWIDEEMDKHNIT